MGNSHRPPHLFLLLPRQFSRCPQPSFPPTQTYLLFPFCMSAQVIIWLPPCIKGLNVIIHKRPTTGLTDDRITINLDVLKIVMGTRIAETGMEQQQ